MYQIAIKYAEERFPKGGQLQSQKTCEFCHLG
jgi:hypothetical protein